MGFCLWPGYPLPHFPLNPIFPFCSLNIERGFFAIFQFSSILSFLSSLSVVCWLKKILLTTPYQSFANRAKLVVEGIENHTKSRNQQTTVIPPGTQLPGIL